MHAESYSHGLLHFKLMLFINIPLVVVCGLQSVYIMRTYSTVRVLPGCWCETELPGSTGVTVTMHNAASYIRTPLFAPLIQLFSPRLCFSPPRWGIESLPLKNDLLAGKCFSPPCRLFSFDFKVPATLSYSSGRIITLHCYE